MQESGEMYLETILLLARKTGHVRAVDVCEYMGFSKPSVSRALSILKSNGFITVNREGGIFFTREGKSAAEKIYDRHTTLSDLLVKLGLNSETASKDACKIEHVISDETFTALKCLSEKIQAK